MSLIAYAEIHRQIVGDPPIVLEIGPNHAGALAPFAGADSPSVGERQPEVKVCATVTAGAVADRVRGGEHTGEGEIAQFAAIG